MSPPAAGVAGLVGVASGGASWAAEVERVRDLLAGEPGELTPHRVAAALRATGGPVGDATVLAVFEDLRRDVVGAGPLEPLLRLDGVTDVLVNGCEPVRVDRGRGLETTDVVLPDEAAVRRLAQRLAALGGRRLDDATPYVDVRLPDGTRCHAVLAPLARPGSAISLRLPRREAPDLAGLVALGMMDAEVASLLRDVVARRLAFLVTGGTGTGKTTLLAAMLGEVDPAERLVVVEDSSELRPRHPHVVGLEARLANAEGAGAVDLRTLVRQSLRMRPDRVVVGEVRGGEVVELMAALNTGHEGGCGTLHANTATSVPARVEALALAAGLGREAAHSQLASALDVVVHLSRGGDGRRRVAEMALVGRDATGMVECRCALRVGPDGVLARGVAARELLDLLDGVPAGA
ncbi:Putative conjugal transfer protein [Nocardioides aquaticus]|uniref:Conjugal transfer protein n=1 Tax=Nocardioides aquaticus TaxID=160826 RepID=A0ABX8EC90_9ACTN|nr:TadA family conjugal transfer-associated ATPase [Nocardioides aquaticus]QVT78043.1 Putative conjugal transfer protein [Nocardioides aquaticus]